MLFVKSLAFFSLVALPLAINANTIGDFTASQSNTILYKSQADEYEARNKLKELNGTAPKPVISPVVLSILGVNGKLFANFLLPDGSRIEGRVGVTLPGDYRVVSIGDQQVVLRKDNKTFTASHYQ